MQNQHDAENRKGNTKYILIPLIVIADGFTYEHRKTIKKIARFAVFYCISFWLFLPQFSTIAGVLRYFNCQKFLCQQRKIYVYLEIILFWHELRVFLRYESPLFVIYKRKQTSEC